MIEIKSFTFNPFMENTYVLYDETREAVIIDPGCYEPEEQNSLTEFIATHKLLPQAILNTHCHIDHVLGNSFVKKHYGIPLYIGEKEQETLKAVEAYAPSYGFQGYEPSDVDVQIKPGDTISFGNSVLHHLFVPGHAPGHIAFYDDTKSFIIGGDVLFDGSIGRTDLPGGDLNTLLASIRNEFFNFPDKTVVFSGHGVSTTIGKEKATNPFCAISLQ
jgi:hydroxyacylglutathione hydrolase